MTRRITIAILASVWTILIVVGIGAYITTYAVLVENMDQRLIEHASSLPQIVDEHGNRYRAEAPGESEDRFVIRSESGRVIRPTTAAAVTGSEPVVSHAAFAMMADGRRFRTVTVQAFAYPESASSGTVPEPVTVTMSAPTESMDELLQKLMFALLGSVTLGGAVSAMLAQRVARQALSPLRATAEAVGAIDEQRLHLRLPTEGQPPELAPVAIKINEMLARLEESSRQRQQFIADASHELRTPVAALMTAIEVTLRRDRDAGDYRHALQSCLADAKLLRSLVESLLNQARSGFSAQQLEIEQILLSQLIDECVTVLQPLAIAKSLQIRVNADAALTVNSASDRLKSILMNLIGNAIEYNNVGGEVVISTRTDGSFAVVSVRDNGPGIASEHIRGIFQPFYRVDASRASGHLGLGLHLVQTNAKSIGGRCEVSSAIGSGTEFTVWIPFHPSTEKSEFSGPAEEKSANASVAG